MATNALYFISVKKDFVEPAFVTKFLQNLSIIFLVPALYTICLLASVNPRMVHNQIWLQLT